MFKFYTPTIKYSNSIEHVAIISLGLMLLSNTVFAGTLSPKAEENMGNAFMSSFIGGMVLGGTFGAGPIVFWLKFLLLIGNLKIKLREY